MSDLHDPMAAILRTREGIASHCLGTGGKACLQPSVRFQHESRDRQHVSAYSLAVLQGAMQRAGIPVVLITSTYRSPAKQAETIVVITQGLAGLVIPDQSTTFRRLHGSPPSRGKAIQNAGPTPAFAGSD